MVIPVNAHDLFTKEARRHPQAVYARMRREDPVYPIIGAHSGERFWVLTRYDDCNAALKDPRIGKEIHRHLPPQKLATLASDPSGLPFLDRILLNIDPPDHTRLRGLVNKAFTPHRIEALRPRIEQIADELLDHVQGHSGMDLIISYAFPLPITVIAELLGVPVDDRDRFRSWTKAVLFGHDDEVMAAGMEFVLYMNRLIETFRAHPGDNLLSDLIVVQDEGSRLSPDELMSMIFLLLVAGHETTVNLIGNGTLLLFQHPDQMQALRDNPSLIKTSVEEMLRYNGPVETTTIRFAFEDVSIGGKKIPQGEIVLAALLAANRDPAIFDRPDEFDISRDPNRHIAFGSGIHYCLGAPLARMECAIAINTLLRRLPRLHLAPGVEDQLEWSESLLLHGLKALPVRF